MGSVFTRLSQILSRHFIFVFSTSLSLARNSGRLTTASARAAPRISLGECCSTVVCQNIDMTANVQDV